MSRQPQINLDASFVALAEWLEENDRREWPETWLAVQRALVYVSDLLSASPLHEKTIRFSREADLASKNVGSLVELSADILNIARKQLYETIDEAPGVVFVNVSRVLLDDTQIELIERSRLAAEQFVSAVQNALTSLKSSPQDPAPLSGNLRAEVLRNVVKILVDGGLTYRDIGDLILDDYGAGDAKTRGERYRKLLGRGRGR